ncbi:MAG: carbon dioxide concentrating mechanism protein [Cyanobacteria bacterium J06635_15]
MTFAPVSVNSSTFYTVGQVEIAPDVVIASGVILEAEPGFCLQIATGVCLGSSVIIQARRGDLRLETGVCIGSGTLIVGRGWIAQGVCIGSESTVINPAIAANNIIAPGSLVGDRSRQQTVIKSPPPPQNSTGKTDEPEVAEAQPQVPVDNHAANSESVGLANFSYVYGKHQVNQLLQTLFPQRQSLNNSNESKLNGSASAENP